LRNAPTGLSISLIGVTMMIVCDFVLIVGANSREYAEAVVCL